MNAVERIPGLAGSLRVVVDVDDELLEGIGASGRAKLARGLVFTQCKGGVRRSNGSVSPNSEHCVRSLEREAATLDLPTKRTAGTATGSWYADRAAFLRVCAELVTRHAARLWPEERT